MGSTKLIRKHLPFRIKEWILQRIETQIILVPLKTAKPPPTRGLTLDVSGPASAIGLRSEAEA